MRGAAPDRRVFHRRPPRYKYRLADINEIFATADDRSDAAVEALRDRIHRRTNWRMVGVLALVAVGVGVIGAVALNEAVSVVVHLFET